MSSRNKIDVKSIINISLRLLIVCTVIAIVVATVNLITKDKIATNEAETINQTIRSVFKNGKIEVVSDVNFGETSATGLYTVYNETSKDIIGYSVLCSPNGFGGKITMMVAFNSDKLITAVRIMDHDETPGIGNKIENSKETWFTEQFVGKNSEVAFGVDGIDKISGSSKSSKGVIKGVNDAIAVIGKIK